MHVDNSKELPTVISFCAGYGGIERGLELAGIEHRVLAYVEIEAFAIANLVAKMEQGELVPAPIYTDLKTFPSDLFRDSVDIITGGYPCQPFSVAGKAQAFDDPRHLFPYILDHVRTIRPAQCFFENVEGHINRGLESVLQDLEGAGYDSTWGIFSAEEVGAPHQRKRIFILANSSGAGRQQISRSTHENESEHEGRSTVQTNITSSHGEGNRERSVANSDSSRQLQSQGSESEQWGWTGDSGQERTMADPDSDDRGDRSSTLPRERWPWLEHRSGSERQPIGQPEEELANPDSSGLKQSHKENENEPSKQPDSRSLQSKSTHTDSEGLEGRLHREVTDSQRWQEQEVRCSTECGHRGSGDRHSGWASEPNVGRVVDGCSDRVDRLRLLGNGVVPQTAARAWEVLNGRD